MDRSQHQQWIFEKLQIKVSMAGASKTKRERDGKSREGSAAFWNLDLDSQFFSEGTQRRTGRCTPPPTNNGHNSTTDTILSSKIIGPVYDAYYYNMNIVL